MAIILATMPATATILDNRVLLVVLLLITCKAVALVAAMALLPVLSERLDDDRENNYKNKSQNQKKFQGSLFLVFFRLESGARDRESFVLCALLRISFSLSHSHYHGKKKCMPTLLQLLRFIYVHYQV